MSHDDLIAVIDVDPSGNQKAPENMADHHRRAPEIVDHLDHLFGREVTAGMAGVVDPKRVDLWLSGTTKPRPDILQRLVVADEAAHVIESEFSEDTTRGWFFRSNPYLDRYTPAEYIKIDPERVLFAARAFADGE